MKLAPLNDIVILRRQEKTETSAGGILLPGQAAEDSIFGEVLAVGPGRVLENGERSQMDVTVGDVVMFDRDYARQSKVDGEEILIVAAENLIATVQK
jgi:chaperonin GroES